MPDLLHCWLSCQSAYCSKMKNSVASLVVGILCLLCSVNGAENEVPEYKRSGSCSVCALVSYRYDDILIMYVRIYIVHSRMSIQISYSTVQSW